MRKVGPCGGGGGVERDMYINGISRIVNISIRHASAIDAIAVRFLRDGREESTEMWGGQGGNLTEFNLEASEYITSVKGHVSTFNGEFVLRSLKFETNLRSYGSYGKEEGTPFELPAIGGPIIGFHGRSGIYLDALGVYVKVNSMMDGQGGGWNAGKPNTRTPGDNSNFWDRSAGMTGGPGGSWNAGGPGTWTQGEVNNFCDRPIGMMGSPGGGWNAGRPGPWTRGGDSNLCDRPVGPTGGRGGGWNTGKPGTWTQGDGNNFGPGGGWNAGRPGTWTQGDGSNFSDRPIGPTGGPGSPWNAGRPGMWVQGDSSNFSDRPTGTTGSPGGCWNTGRPGTWTQDDGNNFSDRPVGTTGAPGGGWNAGKSDSYQGTWYQDRPL